MGPLLAVTPALGVVIVMLLILKAQLHGSQFWRQFFLKSASRFQYSNLIGCVHANYDVIVNILGVRYLENRRTRFRATAPLTYTKGVDTDNSDR